MIDLISTNDGIEEETRCSAHLIAGVIALAIEDLCVEPSEDELVHHCNLNRNAIGSLKFFFNTDSMFSAYASLIGLDPQIFVKALERRHFEENEQKRTKVPFLSHRDVKSLRIRIHWWQKSPVQSRQLELQL